MARATQHDAERGYALLTALIFVVVLGIAGFAFYSLVSSENRAAHYRQSSSEAFLLADGAVERARARFIEDRTWRDGWSGESAGRGTYDLSVSDTTFEGDDAVRLLATGYVDDAQRRVEVLADLPPTGFELTLLVMGDTDVNGNTCLDGSVHINGDPDFGPGDIHLKCGEYTDGFIINPPPIYTDPDHFPDATYYYVRGDSTDRARIFDRDGADITATLGDSLLGLVSWDGSDSSYTFEFKNTDVDKYFNEVTGVFSKSAGDVAVVVNFGEATGIPPGVRSHVVVKADESITATVINTRFTGVTEGDRIDDAYWFGGRTELQQITFEPRYGIALIPYDFEKTGSAQVQLGTEDWPALVYVTHDVTTINANLTLWGSMIVLGDFGSPQITGGPDLFYDEGFIENLPGYLMEEWVGGVSGTLKILRWREIADAGP